MFRYNGLIYKLGPREGLQVYVNDRWRYVSRPSRDLEAAKRTYMVRKGLVHPAWLDPL